MGLIGNEIVQSRIWVDPSTPEPPNLNYKNTFPITVFEAVREKMDDENSATLREVLNRILSSLDGKQPLIAGKPANYIVTYAGVPGAIGSIKISQEIPWNPEEMSNNRIPTEKAVGDFLYKLGLVDKDGNLDPDVNTSVHWQDIMGRPKAYDELGDNDDGFIIQKAVTDIINNLTERIDGIEDDAVTSINDAIDKHIADVYNPHNVTASQLGAALLTDLEAHTAAYNPHNITAKTIGLDKVDNTSDEDKPVSKATQAVIDGINAHIKAVADNMDDLNFVDRLSYDQPSGTLTITYRDGTYKTLHIPIDGLIDEIRYDEDTKELILTELGGYIHRIDLSDLYLKLVGYTDPTVTVEIDDEYVSTDDGSDYIRTGNTVVKAYVNPTSITSTELADNAVTTRTIKDQAVTGDKIRNLSLTTYKYEDESVTTEKIAENAITNSRIDDLAVDGRTLFRSQIANRILATTDKGSNPRWTQINSDMIGDSVIQSSHITNNAIDASKIEDNSINTTKIENSAVTNDKLAVGSVTNGKIANSTIEGSKLVSDIYLSGTPKISIRPSKDANNNEIPDTKWVRDYITDGMIISNTNIDRRAVDGKALFSSSVKERVLVTHQAGSDPVWDQINGDMITDNAVTESKIRDGAVTSDKIADKSIDGYKLIDKSITTDHVADNAITSNKIMKSDNANMVLGATSENSNPVYTKVKRDMIDSKAIGTLQIEDRSVTLSKLETSTESQRVLTVGLKGTNPEWTTITNRMISDKAVDGRTLFSASNNDMVLAVTTQGVDPAWLKVTGNMITEKTITEHNISQKAINKDHLQDKIIDAKHISDYTIGSVNIAPRAVTGTQLFTSAYPSRVLAVGAVPYTDPRWVQVTTDMIENRAISMEKLGISEHNYRVIGATAAGKPPEYLKITNDFIVDDTILPAKLKSNFVLYGTPELTVHPGADADNYQIASTKWVRETVSHLLKYFNPNIMYDSVETDMIADRAVTGSKLFTSSVGPRVLGVKSANANPEYMLVDSNLIADGSVTTNKIQRNIKLMGNPTVETRPSAIASDTYGGGTLVPDCQWVLDRIAEGDCAGPIDGDDIVGHVDNAFKNLPTSVTPGIDSSTGMGCLCDEEAMVTRATNRAFNMVKDYFSLAISPNGYANIAEGSVETKHLMNRSVTADKLFTSATANRLLGVTTSNSNPQYLRVNNDMVADRVINGRTLFTSSTANRILGVISANSNPAYVTINHEMLEENIIATEQIKLNAVTTEKIADEAITSNKLSKAIVKSEHIVDGSVTNSKLADNAVSNNKIVDHSIQGNKLANETMIPAYTTVAEHTDYEKRSIRNTILSPNAPSGGCNGDIWFRYV